MKFLAVGETAQHTGWSARMLRYLERAGSSSRRGAAAAIASTGCGS